MYSQIIKEGFLNLETVPEAKTLTNRGTFSQATNAHDLTLTYPALARSPRHHLVVLAVEVSGRWVPSPQLREAPRADAN